LTGKSKAEVSANARVNSLAVANAISK
jgi:hypothetical protein